MENPNNFEDLMTSAATAARQAGELIREMRNQSVQVNKKGHRDLVTDADFAAQELIISYLKNKYPDHGFLAEEDDPKLKSSGDVFWIIDPLDGTSNYSRSVPDYSVSIAAIVSKDGSISKTALMAEGADYQCVAGAVFDPLRDEMFMAALGLGSWLNGVRLGVSSTSNLIESFIGLDWSHLSANRQKMVTDIARFADRVHTIRAIGSAALALAWVAAARLDVYYNLTLSAWDVAAAGLMIEEAGGRVSDETGAPWRLHHPRCVASNRALHDQFLTYCR